MANNLVYGEESIASAPDNTTGLISADTLRSIIVSQRSGGAQVYEDTAFTVPITAGVPVSINPLLPSPSVGGVLWTADGNNRLTPNYATAIPDIVIPTGYSKAIQVFVTLAAQKTGSGEDNYLFQIDNDGAPLGQGITISLSVEPVVISLLVNSAVALDGGALLGITVTGVGTADDIDVTTFDMFIVDFQRWSAPPAATQIPAGL